MTIPVDPRAIIASGSVLVALGAVYMVWPDLFKKGVWRKTSVAQRLLSQRDYTRYMRVLGAALLACGIGLLLWGVGTR